MFRASQYFSTFLFFSQFVLLFREYPIVVRLPLMMPREMSNSWNARDHPPTELEESVIDASLNRYCWLMTCCAFGCSYSTSKWEIVRVG
jgi:hypothetical protein